MLGKLVRQVLAKLVKQLLQEQLPRKRNPFSSPLDRRIPTPAPLVAARIGGFGGLPARRPLAPLAQQEGGVGSKQAAVYQK